MPAAVPAIIAAIGAGTSATGFLGAVGLKAALLAGVSTFALGQLANALIPDPDSSSLSGKLSGGGATKQVRQAITPRGVIYGEARVSGSFGFIGSTDDNLYMHMVIMLCSHEVEEIGEVWLNDVSVPPDAIDSSGMVTKGQYSGKVRIKKHLGTDGQLADTDLVGAVTEWSFDHRLQGIAYLYVRMEYDRDIFPSGVPNVSAWVRGKKIYDPRIDDTIWSHNAALIVGDYLRDETVGFAIDNANIANDEWIASINNAEEMVAVTPIEADIKSVANNLITLEGKTLSFQTGDRLQISSTGTLPGGIVESQDYYCIIYQRADNPRIMLAATYGEALAGNAISITGNGSGIITITKTHEPRYSAGGLMESNSEPQEVMDSLAAAMAGMVVKSGAHYHIMSGYWRGATLELTERDIFGQIKLQTRTSRRDRFNSVIGTYISPLNQGQPSDYPEVKNSIRIMEDGRAISRKLDQSFIQRSSTAQRVAKVALEKAGQELMFTAPFSLKAFAVKAGDNIMLTIPHMGWNRKYFEVVKWSLDLDEQEEGAIPRISMTLIETAPEVYDWNSGEETKVDPAPNTTLPNYFDVFSPTSLRVIPETVLTDSGDKTYKFRILWNAPANAFVTSGGHYDIQFKKSTDSEWKRSFRAEDEDIAIDINQVERGINYDFRIRAVNAFGVRSSYAALTGFTIESGGGATLQLDYRFFGEAIDTPLLDYGQFTSSMETSIDYGEFV